MRDFERLAAVLVPEEAGIREPGAQHALVAGDDFLAAVIGFEVGDHDEAGRETTVGMEQRQVSLVAARRGDQHLLGHRHELLVDLPDQRHRPFDQAGDLVEQAGIVPDR